MAWWKMHQTNNQTLNTQMHAIISQRARASSRQHFMLKNKYLLKQQ